MPVFSANSRRHSFSFRQNGFTLIELMLTISIFSLILAMGYQALASTAESRKWVIEKADRQQALRTTHRTLSNAFASMADFVGEHNRVQIDLTTADTPWLTDNKKLTLEINRQGQLLAKLDGPNINSVLLDHLEKASFAYSDEEMAYPRWRKTESPDWVQLQWLERGRQVRWRFLAK